MRNKVALLLILLIPYWVYGQKQILEQKVSLDTYDQLFRGISAWQASRSAEWGSTLHALPDALKKQIITDANQANSFTWPALLASQYLGYKQQGNRVDYESPMNRRRAVLSQLVLGEMLERKGKYIPQIANGLWLTLEESTWVSPAHIGAQQVGIGLADPYDSYIDLGAARLAADLAAIYQALPKELDEYSPQLRRKIKYELDRRILVPYATRKDFWWMNYGTATINNWNIWINNNVLRTALLMMDGGKEQQQLVLKIMESADKFIDFYPEDGACEEGPSYWGHAAGELGAMLQLLGDVTNGGFDVSQDTKLDRMGQYILHMHIDSNRFVNFADAQAIEYPPVANVAVFGLLYHDDNLRDFANYLWDLRPILNTGNVQDALILARNYAFIAAGKPVARQEAVLTYPSLELVKWRANPSGEGLTFVGIGGNNGVSHNHNDVGSFMLFADNRPVLIDVGVGTYTRQTFSAERYDIWNMQSQWHNLPLINGQMQAAGKQFKATSVSLPSASEKYAFSLDIAKAYPAAAEVDSWVRTFQFVPKDDALLLTEKYSLKQAQTEQRFMYITAVEPEVKGDEVRIVYAKDCYVAITYDTKNLSLQIEPRVMDDPRLQKVWGDNIYRITFVEKSKKQKATYPFSMKLIRSSK
ncbi:heparinase II/III domain-containing protein [Sphingobacterium sp. MYb382]|uniref:heparinase II/III domain-containing protein n=1 Tax=Sphingobacterium sp. MYb382 TaxID=2745278 RepID=UPI0030A97E0E